MTEVEELATQLRGVQEMLGQVLLTIGEPVVVSKEALRSGAPEGAYVDIDETDDHFIFSIKVDK